MFLLILFLFPSSGNQFFVLRYVAYSILIKTIQVKVLCKVNHSDLRQLLLVSKLVSEAVSTSESFPRTPILCSGFVAQVY